MARTTGDDFIREVYKSHPERPCFAGRDLRGIKLAGHQLGQIDFSGADLRGADLHEARITGADLSNADLSHADLRGASLRHAWLKCATLAGADLRDADLSYAMLAQTDLASARLRGAWMDGVELSGTELPERWRSITRIHVAPERPFARPDVVAAVGRDLADDDRPAALATLRAAVAISASDASLLLARLLAAPIDSLAALRSAELPPALDAALAAVTREPAPDETMRQLAALSGAEPVACRRRGLRWTIEQVLRQRQTMGTFMLLRHLGLALSAAKLLMDQADRHRELLLEVMAQVDDDLLAPAADRLASELWGLDFDAAVRVLWGLRAGLRAA